MFRYRVIAIPWSFYNILSSVYNQINRKRHVIIYFVWTQIYYTMTNLKSIIFKNCVLTYWSIRVSYTFICMPWWKSARVSDHYWRSCNYYAEKKLRVRTKQHNIIMLYLWSFAQQRKVDKVTTPPHLVWSGCDNKQNPIQPVTTAHVYYYNNTVKETEENKIKKKKKIDAKVFTNEGEVNEKLWSLITDNFFKAKIFTQKRKSSVFFDSPKHKVNSLFLPL